MIRRWQAKAKAQISSNSHHDRWVMGNRQSSASRLRGQHSIHLPALPPISWNARTPENKRFLILIHDSGFHHLPIHPVKLFMIDGLSITSLNLSPCLDPNSTCPCPQFIPHAVSGLFSPSSAGFDRSQMSRSTVHVLQQSLQRSQSASVRASSCVLAESLLADWVF